MANIFLLANVATLLTANVATTTDFSTVIKHATQEEQIVLKENKIDTWEKYETYVQEQNSTMAKSSGAFKENITNCEEYLNLHYPQYIWWQNSWDSALTSDVSGFIPRDVGGNSLKVGNPYWEEERTEVIILAGVDDKTDYGGCGPIAGLGIFDYLAKYIGYTELIEDSDDPKQRVQLAAELFKNTHYSVFGNIGASKVWPWDYTGGFDTVKKNHGLQGSIVSKHVTNLLGLSGDGKKNLETLKENIKLGMPVTVYTDDVGDSDFSGHYSNIYGYETWFGIPKTEGETIEKVFLKGWPNFGENEVLYCDADILNTAFSGIVTYKQNFKNQYMINASDFAKDFVNASGKGQYFFYPVSKAVTLSSGTEVMTERLRCSYIEDKYLVLSPNRINAGTAYLDITFPHPVNRVTFDAAQWSENEYTTHETLNMQYYDSNGWNNHVTIDVSDLSKNKENPDSFVVVFPRKTTRIRFYSTIINATADRNKGRVVLENINVEYD